MAFSGTIFIEYDLCIGIFNITLTLIGHAVVEIEVFSMNFLLF